MLVGQTTYRARIIGLVFFCVLMLQTGAGAMSSGDSFKPAEDLILSGKYRKAVDYYRNILGTSTQSAEKARALFFIGSLYGAYLDQPDKALSAFRDVRQRFPGRPESADALFHTACLLYRLDRRDDARQAFEDYIKAYPVGDRHPSALAWLDLGFPDVKKPVKKPEKEPSVAFVAPTIRVLLVKNEDQLVFKASSGLTVRDVRSGRILKETDGPLVIALTNGHRYINTRRESFRECEIRATDNIIRMEGRAYRGAIRVMVKPRGMMAVNHLSVEEYLYGVVPKEMSWLWDEQALMAQAIASRTYALYIRETRQKRGDYDLEASTVSQVYGGLDAEKEPARRAVKRTRGMVVTYKGHLAAAYFHANSGGHTESASRVWNIDLPYLNGVSDPFNSLQPDAIWHNKVSLKEARNRLKHLVPGLGPVTDITVGKKSPSGRVLTVNIHSGSRHVSLNSNSFRLALGPTEIRSTFFDISRDGQALVFKGVGYGHGVGMSQWGAQCMALAGYDCEDILKHYYSGAEIGRVSYL